MHLAKAARPREIGNSLSHAAPVAPVSLAPAALPSVSLASVSPQSLADRDYLGTILASVISNPFRWKDPVCDELLRFLRSFAPRTVPTHTPYIACPGELTPFAAGNCVSDWPRTYRFINAIHNACLRLSSAQPGKEIFMLDAGAGPFAFLSLVAATLCPRVNAIALENNPESALSAQHLIERLGLSGRVSVQQTDALRFRPAREIDLLATETFDCGLQREQGARILSRFIPHLSPRGLVVPDGVSVDATVRRAYGVLKLSPKFWRPVFKLDRDGLKTGPGMELIAERVVSGRYQVFLSTRLTFGTDISALDRHCVSPISSPALAGEFSVEKGPAQIFAKIIPGNEGLELEVSRLG